MALADRAVWMVVPVPGGLRAGLGLRRGVVDARRGRRVLGDPQPPLVVGGRRRVGGRAPAGPSASCSSSPPPSSSARVWRSARHRRAGLRGRRRRRRRSSGPAPTWLWVGLVVRQLLAPVLHPGPAARRRHRPAQPAVGGSAPDGRARSASPTASTCRSPSPSWCCWCSPSAGGRRPTASSPPCVLLAALGAENLNSLERYGLNAFPLALTLAVLAKDPRVDKVLDHGARRRASSPSARWPGSAPTCRDISQRSCVGFAVGPHALSSLRLAAPRPHRSCVGFAVGPHALSSLRLAPPRPHRSCVGFAVGPHALSSLARRLRRRGGGR